MSEPRQGEADFYHCSHPGSSLLSRSGVPSIAASVAAIQASGKYISSFDGKRSKTISFITKRNKSYSRHLWPLLRYRRDRLIRLEKGKPNQWHADRSGSVLPEMEITWLLNAPLEFLEHAALIRRPCARCRGAG